MVLPNTPDPGDVLARLLDAGYNEAAGPVVAAISQDAQSGALATRLKQFDARAKELADAGQKMTGDDPVLRALLADFQDSLKDDAGLINRAGSDLVGQGMHAADQFLRVTALDNMSDGELARIGVAWNRPDPAAIAQVVDYTARPAWQYELEAYETDVTQQVNMIALRGIIEGKGPLAIAREVRAAVESIPISRAQNLMRTLQLTSYRDAQAVQQRANSDILEYQIRIAALDSRCCMACVMLHGTKLAIGERVDDHHQGRCTAITKVKWRSAPVVQSGAAWFEGRSASEQRAQMGHAAFEAWKSGAIQLHDFVQKYNDPVFGSMIREASLKGLLGDGATRFYGGKGPGGGGRGGSIDTLNGSQPRDVGKPGHTLESLQFFVNSSRGPLRDALMNDEMGLLEVSWLDDSITINNEQVRLAARRFVKESQDIQYSKDYIIALARQQAADKGVQVTDAGAARLYNQFYATQAKAIKTAADIGKVGLTDAQQRRLDIASVGKYLDMVYTTDTSEAGSLANRATARRKTAGGIGSANLTAAAKDEQRRVFLEYLGRSGQ